MAVTQGGALSPPPLPPSSSQPQWPEVAATEAAAAAAASAVSPLLAASDGVWETGAPSGGGASGSGAGGADGDGVGARSKLYYHLAAVFPEDQVMKALAALPDETNPQKICSYILRLSKP